MSDYQLLCGDAVQVLKTLPSGSVQMCCSSPPYFGLRSYLPDDHPDKEYELGAEETPEAYVSRMVEVFREVRRVLHPTGVLFLNIGDSYYNYRPGGVSQTKQTLAKHNGSVVQYSSKRNATFEGIKEKDLLGIPWMLAFALRADGWWLRQEIIWHKLAPMPESVTDRCTKAHEQVFLLAKSRDYFFDNIAIAEQGSPETPKRAMRGVGENHKNVNGAPGQTRHSMNLPRSHASGRANSTTLRGSAGRPELSATLHTEDGAVSLRGWCDFGQSQVAVNDTVTFDTQRFQVVEPIGLQVGIETSEGNFVMDLERSLLSSATATGIAIALARFFSDGAPVPPSVANVTAAPCGAILASEIDGKPFAGTLERAKVVGLDCAFVLGELFAACITLDCQQARCSLFVWTTFWSTHSGSFLPQGNNIIPQESGTRNKRSVWTLGPEQYSGSHYAVMPTKLVEPCVLAGTSAKGCCAQCGAPWERIIETHTEPRPTSGPLRGGKSHKYVNGGLASNVGTLAQPTMTTNTTIGWQPTCTCNADIAPCVVLDPFAGSGTTLAVALKFGRRAIGIDLDERNMKLAHDRIAKMQPMLFSEVLA